MLTIECVQGLNRGTVFERDSTRVTIGRAAGNEVSLPDEPIAEHHAQLFRELEQWNYQDLTHGGPPARIRRRGGEIVVEGTRPVALVDGDLVQIGGPGGPVLSVRLGAIDESTVPAASIVSERAFDEFPRVADNVTRDSRTARKLLEVTQKLGRRGLDLRAVFDGLAEAVFELAPRATHVAVALADDRDKRFNTVFTRQRERVQTAAAGGESPRASRAVVRSVQRERYAILVTDKEADSPSLMDFAIECTMGVPLWDGAEISGVMQVDNRGGAGIFTQDDLDLMVTLAGQATLAIENARLYQRLQAAEDRARGENRFLKNREERRRSNEIIGDAPSMQSIFRLIDKVKDTRATVCIEGETGTGKELIASAIHYQGSRRDKLFVAQNCAAMPENLLESELFGHKKGAFTGADHDKKGLFEIADSGTLFLDEIGEMSLGLQAKLLRVLQEGEIRPVGAVVARAVDVRIICATNRALEKEVERGTFRQDLYYRLKVFPIRLPPLRERREDIAGLVDHFLRRYTAEMKKPIAGITPESMDQLSSYNWPGNIRELENEVQRLVIQADAEAFITPELLAPQIRRVEELMGRVAPQVKKTGALKDRVEEVERWMLTEALREHGGNKTKTAETLGMTREGLHKKLAKYGL